MDNQQLLDYIKEQSQQGISEEQIKSSLLASGWPETDVNKAFSAISSSTSSAESPLTSPSTNSTLPGPKALFGQTWSLYKQRLGTFLGIMIIPMLAMAGGSGVFALLSSDFAAARVGLAVALAIITFLVIFTIQAWGHTSLLYAIKDSQEGIGIKEAYRRGWRKILAYWWVIILAGFITLGGFLLFVVPGIIFAVWFCLAIYVLIGEDLKGMNALLKSREYVRGRWGGVLWRFFVIGIFSLIATVSAVLILSLVPYGGYINQLVSWLLITPLTTAYGFMVYSSLKALKGEAVPASSGGQKAKFLIVAALGILLVPVILYLIVFPKLSNMASFSNINPPGSASEMVHDASREADIRQIQSSLESFYFEHEYYPFMLDELEPHYIATLPVDPKTGLPYEYQRRGTADYQLCVQLETREEKCVTTLFPR